jgi:hypothetical protein
MFLGYIVLQLCCSYTVWHMYWYFTRWNVSYFYICTFRSMCAVPSIVVFGSSFRAFPVRFSGVSWMNLRRFQLPLLLLVSLLFFKFHMRCISIVSYLYFRTFSFLSWPHSCLLKSQHLLTHRFLFHSHGLWCPGWYYYYYYYYYYVSCHRPILPGHSLEPTVIPTAQASSSTLQYFPYYVWCSKYSCLL